MKSKTTIEFNGTRYDAVNGDVVSDAPTGPAQNIDGFFRARKSLSPKTPPVSDSISILGAPAVPKPTSTRAPHPLNHAQAHRPQSAKTSTIRVRTTEQASQQLTVHHRTLSATHAKAHATQNSQTLMRSAVKRPVPSFRSQVSTTGTLQHAVPGLIAPKKSVLSLDEQRLARAQTTPRSPLVAHHVVTKSGITATVAPLAVAPHPVKPQEHVPAYPPAPTPTNKPTDIFEHALANASHYVDLHTHRQAYRKKVHTHVASMLAGSLVLIAIAGFVAYQNSPVLQFKVASIRAGVSAHAPNLAALGFSWGGVKAQDGKLIVGLKQGSAAYTVTQQTTNLTSADMIQSIGATDASGTPDYTAVQAGSTTVYKFGNTTATWIQNGKWYTLTGSSTLDNTQLQKLVRSV